jgi:hypothetical protein
LCKLHDTAVLMNLHANVNNLSDVVYIVAKPQNNLLKYVICGVPGH